MASLGPADLAACIEHGGGDLGALACAAAGQGRLAPRLLGDRPVCLAGRDLARDRKGLLYDLTHALSGLRLQISSAKVSTFGERAIDVFYVKDKFGLKIDDEARLEAIREALKQALAEPGARPGEPAGKSAAAE